MKINFNLIKEYIKSVLTNSDESVYNCNYINTELNKKQENLEIKAYTKTLGVINAGQDLIVNTSLDDGYTYLGVVGANFGGGNYTYLSMTSNYVHNNTQINTVIHNFGSTPTDSITIILYVLRYKN